MSGEVVHFEIPADNVERASAFYSKTFGWRMDSRSEIDYTLVRTAESDASGMPKNPGTINGGILRRQAPVRVPVVTIMVDSIDAAVKAIEKNGGRMVVPKAPIGDGTIGFAGYFKDSEGNVVGLFERAQR